MQNYFHAVYKALFTYGWLVEPAVTSHNMTHEHVVACDVK
jgi:hypothetical protein